MSAQLQKSVVNVGAVLHAEAHNAGKTILFGKTRNGKDTAVVRNFHYLYLLDGHATVDWRCGCFMTG